MKEENAIDKVFKTITLLKGIHAIIEIISGILLFMISKEFIAWTIVKFVDGGIVAGADNFIIQYITQFGLDLTLATKFFFGVYLLSHGIVNLSLVYGIIKKPFWAYPISILFFIGFIIYQTYSYFILPSGWLLFLTIFDIFFIGLVFYEYNRLLKTHSFLGKIKLIVTAEVPPIVEIKTLKRYILMRRGKQEVFMGNI